MENEDWLAILLFLMIFQKFPSLFGLKCAKSGDYQGMAQKTRGSLACDLQNEEWARKMFSFCPHEAKTSLKCLAKGCCCTRWTRRTEAEKSGLLWTTVCFSVESGNVLLNMMKSLKPSSFFFFKLCFPNESAIHFFSISLGSTSHSFICPSAFWCLASNRVCCKRVRMVKNSTVRKPRIKPGKWPGEAFHLKCIRGNQRCEDSPQVMLSLSLRSQQREEMLLDG